MQKVLCIDLKNQQAGLGGRLCGDVIGRGPTRYVESIAGASAEWQHVVGVQKYGRQRGMDVTFCMRIDMVRRLW